MLRLQTVTETNQFNFIRMIIDYDGHAQRSQKTHQEMRYPNVTSLYFATPLAFNAPDGGFSSDVLGKLLYGVQRIANADVVTLW